MTQGYTPWFTTVIVGLLLALGSGIPPAGAQAPAGAADGPLNPFRPHDGPVGATDLLAQEEDVLFEVLEDEEAPASASRPSPVSACTAAPDGYVCLYVWRLSTYIFHVRTVRGKAAGSRICNWQAVMYVNDARGRRIDTQLSPVQPGCDGRRVWYDFYPMKHYPDGSHVCTAFYENGVQQGGSPCLLIKQS